MNKHRVIIAGGSGLVGRALASYLAAKGYETVILTRKAEQSHRTESENHHVRYSTWDTRAKTIDRSLFAGAYHLINLSGENIGGRRWTAEQKNRIVASRVTSAQFLAEICQSSSDRPCVSISMSALGIYGAINSERIFTETDTPATDFLGDTCKRWEESNMPMEALSQRSVILRLGIVLSAQGGALPKMALPVKLMAGSYIGTGRQYMSWIHIEDLCRWILYCMENESVRGVYNTCSPESVTNREFTRGLCAVLQRPFIPIGIPAFLLKLLLGEMSVILTQGSRADAGRMTRTGFAFRYPSLQPALDQLLTTKKGS